MLLLQGLCERQLCWIAKNRPAKQPRLNGTATARHVVDCEMGFDCRQLSLLG